MLKQLTHHAKFSLKILRVSFILAVLLVSGIGPSAAALTSSERANLYEPFYDSNGTDCAIGSLATAGSIASDLPAAVPEPHRTLFAQAAKAFNVNAQFLTAIFLSENGNQWKPFDTKWASSPVGASGPFQFMPLTWSAYAYDGNNDGIKDVNNIYDASYAAAKLLGTSTNANTPLGDINKPFAPDTMLYTSAVYNWGGGNVKQQTDPNSPLSVAPKETQDYLNNIYMLITSGFTKSGKSTYPDPRAPAGGVVKNTTTPQPSPSSCANGAVQGSIVQTAVNYAWPSYHSPNFLNMKAPYAAAIKAAEAAGKYVGGGPNPGIDCGGFVTRVMQDSGVDPNYGGGGNTDSQERYMLSHPELYTQLRPSSTADLQPGDIAINGDHTYMYVGPVPGFGSTVASASFSTTNTSWRAPMAGHETPADPSFRWYRHK